MKYLITTEIEIPDTQLPKGTLSEATEGLRKFARGIAQNYELHGATVTDVRVTRMDGPVET